MAQDRRPRVTTIQSAAVGIAFVLVAGIVVLLANLHMRQQALADASVVAEEILVRNLATHDYFNDRVKPAVFDLLTEEELAEHFDPTLMSSTHAVQWVERQAWLTGGEDFYYKQCAINARSPENEAIGYERAFLKKLQAGSEAAGYETRRVIDGEPYLVVMRPGRTMAEDCLRCHGDPENAPSELVARYGDEGGFGRQVGDVVSATSIRVPLAAAYSRANAFSLQLSLLLLIPFACLFAVQHWVNRRVVFAPLARLRRQAARIAGEQERLGEEIPLPHTQELGELTDAFNAMSRSLKEERDGLHDEISKRTRALRQANEDLQRDIERRIEVEQALRMTQYALDNAPDAVMWMSTDGDLVYANEAAGRLAGVEAHDLMSLRVFDVFEDVDRDTWLDHWLTPSVVPMAREGAIRCEDGTSLPVEIAGRVVQFGGQCIFCAYVRDVSERRRAEEERQQLQAQVLDAQRLDSLEIMAGGIAHDFNNILMAVTGNASLARVALERGVDALGHLDRIESAAERASDLARQMLAYSGRSHTSFKPVNIAAVVGEMASLLRAAVPKKVELTLIQGDGPCIASCDATQLRQIVLNLITNASEAIGDNVGRIIISAATRSVEAAELERAHPHDSAVPGPYVCIGVADDGCGMDEETLKRAFDPFFTTKFTGRGLGLAAVFGIVRGHRGAIRVESTHGEGTAFTVMLPAAGSPAEDATEPMDTAREAVGV